jgi:hypothetical protein
MNKDAPNFAAWSLENLVKFSTDSYQRLIEQEQAIEQLRLDLRDAMKLARRQHESL